MIKFTDTAAAKAETKPSPETKLARARDALETKPRKGGRPRKHEGDPWVAEGLSRSAWYRARKAKPE